ncbi:MAG TPA: NAD(P)H-binding protein [Candidatus Acidoferrales bacterium]|nr:NAD(P)H-binding protein [Candidatus Acidoferrales bacterium]
MKIALFGSTGRIGRRILNEALARGHQVTAIVRDASTQHDNHKNVEFKTGDVLKAESVAVATRGADVVISAYGPGAGDANQIASAAKSLVEGLNANHTARLIVVGSAGNLQIAPNQQLLDTPEFAAYKKFALAHGESMEILKKSSLDWTYVIPSAEINEGTRTGRYRTAKDDLLVDDKGQSQISMEDFAVAVLDEVEKPQFRRARFTVGY